MAYNFNAINSALGDDEQKLNMFESPGGASSEGVQANGSLQSSSVGSGSYSSNASSGSSAPLPPKGVGSFATIDPSSSAKAYRGIGNVGTTKARGRIEGDIASANSKLQAEANTYGQKAKDTAAGYRLDSDTLKQAADGNAEAISKTQQRLTATAPAEFEAFGGLKAGDIPTSANVLKDKETWGNIFKKDASADYGAGENRLQGMLLRQNGFQPEARRLIGQQDKLIKDNDAAVSDKTKATREELSKAYSDATGQARTELTGMSDKITADAKVKADAEAIRRAGLDPAKLSAEEFKKIADDLRRDFAGSTGTLGRSLSYLDDPANFDLSSYVNVDRDVTPDEFLTKEEVDRFNRINGLLGNSDLKHFQEAGAGSDYSFDGIGATDRIRSILEGKRQGEDQRIQGLMDEIQASAESRRLAEDPYANIRNSLQAKYLDNNEGQSEREIQAERDAIARIFEGQEVGPRAGWQDMLTADEAAQMNQYATDLGLPESRYAAGDNSMDPVWDDRFNRIMADILAANAPTQAPSDVKGFKETRKTPDNAYDKLREESINLAMAPIEGIARATGNADGVRDLIGRTLPKAGRFKVKW